MKIDFAQAINNLDDKQIDTMTLKSISVVALSETFRDERNPSIPETVPAEEKFSRGELAMRIHAATEPLELKSQDVTLLKKVIARGYGPIVVYRAWPMLDAAEKVAA